MIITRRTQAKLYEFNYKISGDQVHEKKTMPQQVPELKNGKRICAYKNCQKSFDKHVTYEDGSHTSDHKFVPCMRPQPGPRMSQRSFGPYRNPDGTPQKVTDFIYAHFSPPHELSNYVNKTTVDKATTNMIHDRFNTTGQHVIRVPVQFTCQNGIIHIEQKCGRWTPTFTPFREYCMCQDLPRALLALFPCRCKDVNERLKSNVVQKSFPKIYIDYKDLLTTMLGPNLHPQEWNVADEEWAAWYNGGNNKPFENLVEHQSQAIDAAGQHLCVCGEIMQRCDCETFTACMRKACFHCGNMEEDCPCAHFCPFKMDRHKAAMAYFEQNCMWVRKIFHDQDIDLHTMVFWVGLWFGRSQFPVNTHDKWGILLNLYGKGGCGKGVNAELLKELFEPSSGDMLVIPTSDQEQFAGGNMFHTDGSLARVGLCMDANTEKMVERATICSMAVGEAVRVALKGEAAVSTDAYTTVLCYCSNMPIYQNGDQGGSLERRVVYMNFIKKIVMNLSLPDIARMEILCVLMVALLEYFHHADSETNGARSFWQFCPPYFKKQRGSVRRECNPVASFLTEEIDKGEEGLVFNPQASIPWADFARAVEHYIKQRLLDKSKGDATLQKFNKKAPADSEDTLHEFGLRLTRGNVIGVALYSHSMDNLPSYPPNMDGGEAAPAAAPPTTSSSARKRARTSYPDDQDPELNPDQVYAFLTQAHANQFTRYSEQQKQALKSLMADMMNVSHETSMYGSSGY